MELLHRKQQHRCRYFNVAIVDAEGKPTSTQLYTDDPTLAVSWIANRARYFGVGRRDSVVAAYVFDTGTNELRHFDVTSNGYLRLVGGRTGDFIKSVAHA